MANTTVRNRPKGPKSGPHRIDTVYLLEARNATPVSLSLISLAHHITSQFTRIERLPDPQDPTLARVDQPALRRAVEQPNASPDPLFRFLDEIWRQYQAHAQQRQQPVQMPTGAQPYRGDGVKRAGNERPQPSTTTTTNAERRVGTEGHHSSATRSNGARRAGNEVSRTSANGGNGGSVADPSQPSPKSPPNPRNGEGKKDQKSSGAKPPNEQANSTASKSSSRKPAASKKNRPSTKTLKVSANWSSDVIVALKQGDADALKAALGGVDKPAPKTIQDQIDLEYPPSKRPYGPWGVPLPTLLQPETDIHKDKRMVRQYLGGLILVYDKMTHSVRVALPEKEQRASPIEEIPGAMVARFSRATTKVWKWIKAMKESREVIPIDEWISNQLEEKRDKYKAAIYEYAETLNIQTQNRCIRKKSTPGSPEESPIKKRKTRDAEKENDSEEVTKPGKDNASARPKSSKRHRKE
ncbi:hypothetical protein V8F20_012491 [Naviculisporaceae sp. PSN 640]